MLWGSAMFCRYCGNSLPDDSAFCNRCGNRQDESGGLVSPPFPIAPNSPGYYPAGNVPAVQGTPSFGNVPSVQGTPPMGNAPSPPHPVHPFTPPVAHSAGNAAAPYGPQPAQPYPQPAAPQAPTYYPPQPHDARNHPHAQAHHAQQGVHHARAHKARQVGGISHAAIVVVTVAAVVIVGGGLAWAFAHNQQPSPAGPASIIPTHIPSPTVFRLAVNAAQDSPGLDTGINVTAGSRVTIIAQGTAAYGVSGAGCPEVTHPDGSIVSRRGSMPARYGSERNSCFGSCWRTARQHWPAGNFVLDRVVCRWEQLFTKSLYQWPSLSHL